MSRCATIEQYIYAIVNFKVKTKNKTRTYSIYNFITSNNESIQTGKKTTSILKQCLIITCRVILWFCLL